MSAPNLGGQWFKPWLSHSKDFKNGIHGEEEIPPLKCPAESGERACAIELTLLVPRMLWEVTSLSPGSVVVFV